MSLRPLWAILLIVAAVSIVGGIHYAGGTGNALFSGHSGKGWMLIVATAVAAYVFWRTRR